MKIKIFSIFKFIKIFGHNSHYLKELSIDILTNHFDNEMTFNHIRPDYRQISSNLICIKNISLSKYSED